MTENLNKENQVESKFKIFLNKVKEILSFIYEHYIKFPAYILAHPIKGFDDFKRENKGKLQVANVFIILLIIINIIEFQYTGFVVSQRDKNDLNTVLEIGLVLVPIVLITIGNWSVTTLFDGKGKMKEIYMMLGYSLFPLIIAKIIGVIFSNMITLDEVGFYSLILGIGVFLMVYKAFFGFISIHEYGLLKNIGAILLTVLAILIILFVVLLSFDLFQQVYSFVYTIYREITMRYF